MTLKTIMDILGETLAELHATPHTSDSFEGVVKKAEFESKIAKQFINGADITVRIDKMSGRTDRSDKLLGV